ncbi:MAG: hypothetical protein AAGB46_00115 [Verrucomicrobiota bacterium]
MKTLLNALPKFLGRDSLPSVASCEGRADPASEVGHRRALQPFATKALLALAIAISTNSSVLSNETIGHKDFVHVEKQGGIWTMVKGDGEAFVPLGMNHVGPMSRFAPYNREHWAKEIGGGILKNGRVDFKSEGAKTWLEIIAKDHKDYGFNTLAFHHPHTLPTEYCNELELYYFAKLRMSHVHARRAKRMSATKMFPDVFDSAWVQRLDHFVENFTARHRDGKYLLGYSYDDLPAYTIHNLERPIRKFEHHPWIVDVLSKPGKTKGKSEWIEVLQKQYSSAAKAGDMYGLAIKSWDDFYDIKSYGLPKDEEQGFADQALMNAKIIRAYHKAHHDAIRKYDPHHLILGDKIQNARSQPDWVWNIVKEYVDVILIQDYDFFTPLHAKKLRHIYEVTGKPIINGDHAYGAIRPNMENVKGVVVPTMKDKGEQYAVYLKGIMSLPFMLGWQTCGYLETWTGTSDATGKSQTGYFDPMGRPILEALEPAREANASALAWRRQAGKEKISYSTMKRAPLRTQKKR